MKRIYTFRPEGGIANADLFTEGYRGSMLQYAGCHFKGKWPWISKQMFY
jgi:hypothetical protein